jgi:hypothetical protein
VGFEKILIDGGMAEIERVGRLIGDAMRTLIMIAFKTVINGIVGTSSALHPDFLNAHRDCECKPRRKSIAMRFPDQSASSIQTGA